MGTFPPRIAIWDDDSELVQLLVMILKHRFAGLTARRIRDFSDVPPADISIVDLDATGLEPARRAELLAMGESRNSGVILVASRSAGEDGSAPEAFGERVLIKLSARDEDNFSTRVLARIDQAMRSLRSLRRIDPGKLDDRSREVLCRVLTEFRGRVRGGDPNIRVEELSCASDLLAALRHTQGDLLTAHYVHRLAGIEPGPEGWSELPWEALHSVLPGPREGADRPLVFARIHTCAKIDVRRAPPADKLRGLYCEVQSGSGNRDIRGCQTAFERFLGGPAILVDPAPDVLSAVEIRKACGEFTDDEPVDILHIVCHVDPADGTLILRTEFHAALRTSGRELADSIAHRPPRVVVLQTCCPGLGPDGTVARLIEVGVDAVVCFQVNPTNITALEVMTTFYERLKEEGRLDLAVWETRKKLKHLPGAACALVLAVRDESCVDTLWRPAAGEPRPTNFAP